jgi:hypothetical protein
MDGFMKGSKYLEMQPSERAAYAAGFVNGMSVSAMVLNLGSSPREPRWLADCIRGMTDRQIAEIIRKDVQDRPAEWHTGLNRLGLNAVVSACKAYWSPGTRQ